MGARRDRTIRPLAGLLIVALQICASAAEITPLPPTDGPLAAQSNAPANSGPTPEQFSAVLRRLEATEAEIAALRQQQTASKGDGHTAYFDDPQTPPPPPDVDSTGPEQIELGSRLTALENLFRRQQNTYPSILLSGFFQLDTGLFNQDAASMATLGNIQNGTGFRRARLQALGYLNEFSRFSVEMDFAAAGHPSFMDVWGEHINLPLFGNGRIGQFRQPITMDSWTNTRHLEFMERSAPFMALDPFRRVGAMAWRNSEDQRSLLAYSVYGTGLTFANGAGTVYNTMGIDNPFATQIGNHGGIAFAIRGTHLLCYDEPAEGRYLLHVGGGYSFAEIGGNGTVGPDARTYQATTIPEFFVGDPSGGGLTAAGTPFVVDTGRFLANNYSLYHAELAGNYGAAHFQTEFIASAVNQVGGPTVFLPGAYFQCGYFLTGESCGYNKYFGALDYNVVPFSPFFGLGPNRGMCGWGAWEMAFRWSYLDLSARNINPANIVGPIAGPPPSPNPGLLNETTLALNWWWSVYTRVQFNWIHSMANYNTRGFAALDVWAVRYQIEF